MEVAALRCQQKLPCDSPLLNAWLGLCVPMAEVSHILNNREAAHSKVSFSLPKLMSQLQHWYDNVGPELNYDETRLTNLNMAGYGLHTQYCKVQILLNKAFDLSSNPQKRKLWQMDENMDHDFTSESCGREIYRYSLRIARLVVTYREVFGVDKIPSIMLDNAIVAATGLIKYFNQNSNNGNLQQRDVDWIRLLIKTLESVQPHFPITKRMLHTLRHVSEGYPLSNSLFHPANLGEVTSTLASQQPTNAQTQMSNAESNMVGMGFDPMGHSDAALWTGDMESAPNGFFSRNMDDMFSTGPFAMLFCEGLQPITNDLCDPCL